MYIYTTYQKEPTVNFGKHLMSKISSKTNSTFSLEKKINKKMLPSLILLFFMGAMQAVIGWWMVYSGLQQKPAVSHYRLAIHLMSAFTLFAFTFWFALKLLNPKEEASISSTHSNGDKLKWWSFSFFLVLISSSYSLIFLSF